MPVYDPILTNIDNALYYDNNGNVAIRTGISGGSISISGPITIPGTINVQSTAEDPVDVHIRQIGTSGILDVAYMPVTLQDSTGHINDSSHPVYTNFTNTSIGVTGTFWQATQPISGTVTANVTFPTTQNVTVNENAGLNFAFNNHAAASHRGWVMDDTMRPMISIRVNSSGTSAADLIQITEYQIGNNNAAQSTIMYEWYEGDLTIAGAAIPNWTSFGTKGQYRVYQDQYSSNQGNTFTVPSGTYHRHSGIIIGKNADGDEGPVIMHGGATPNMLTLCMKRLDNATELDVWFAFTCKELI